MNREVELCEHGGALSCVNRGGAVLCEVMCEMCEQGGGAML